MRNVYGAVNTANAKDDKNFCFFVNFGNYSEQQKIVYLHKRNFEISNSRHADEKSTNWSHAMLSRGTKNAS